MRQTVTKEDLRKYKDGALRTHYDIESLYDIFTVALINDNVMSLMMFANDKFDDLTNDDIIAQMKTLTERPETRKWLELADDKTLDYHVYRYTLDEDGVREMSKDLTRIIMCLNLPADEPHVKKRRAFTEYWGWNTSGYDLDMLILVKMLANKFQGKLQPSYIRRVSDLLIQFNGFPSQLYDYMEEATSGTISAVKFRHFKHNALWADGHIDTARLVRTAGNPSDTDNLMPPGLKKQMAFKMMDIIEDDTVKDSKPRDWTQDEKNHLIDYNFNDVIGERFISQDVESEIRVRDIVRELYPYTSAKATHIGDLNQKRPPNERDALPSDLAAWAAIGPNRNKPKDGDTIQYMFPVPDGNGGERKVDLWQYMMEKETYIHPYMNDFFSYFRGKDIRDKRDADRVKFSQPINGKSMVNIPYYYNGKPTDSYVRVSTGGAHGSVMAGLSEKTEDEVNDWIRSDRDLKVTEKPTVDALDVIHLDFKSYYPMLCSKLELYYIAADGIDRTKEGMEHRFKIKDESKALFAQGLREGDPEFDEKEEMQLGLKLFLNNITGKGNTHKPWALLPVDNKTYSMRLIGNMFIWCLAQRLAAVGGYIISTNTDGVYLSGLDVDTVQTHVDKYMEDYGIEVEPEVVKRFINRDVSTRIEFYKDVHQGDVFGGDLRHGRVPYFTKGTLTHNPSYPIVCGHAVVRYLEDDLEWLTKPYDPERLRGYIQEVYDNSDTLEPFIHVYAGTSARRLTKDGIPSQRINRVVFTKEGHVIGQENNRELNRADSIDMWNQLIDGASDWSDITLKDKDTDDRREAMLTDGITDASLKDRTFDFVVKKKQRNGENEYIPMHVSKTRIEAPDKKDTDAMDTYRSYKLLGYYDDTERQWKPVKAWKTGKVSNYQTDIGRTLNTYESVATFDKTDLDLESYFLWAEKILSTWKRTADIPAVGLVAMDDTVGSHNTSSKKRLDNDEDDADEDVLSDAERRTLAHDTLRAFFITS